MSDLKIVKDGVVWLVYEFGAGTESNMLIAQPVERHEGWDVTKKTSPSGKRVFRCKTCGRESVTPDKICPIGEIVDLLKHLKLKRISYGSEQSRR